jgi:hypothetical protein
MPIICSYERDHIILAARRKDDEDAKEEREETMTLVCVVNDARCYAGRQAELIHPPWPKATYDMPMICMVTFHRMPTILGSYCGPQYLAVSVAHNTWQLVWPTILGSYCGPQYLAVIVAHNTWQSLWPTILGK